jgi:hypothetical protein
LASRVFPVVLALELETPGAGPTVPLEIRRLIREMSIANPLWGAPRIHGELLKLGIDIGQTSKAGTPSSAIMPTASRRWICSSFRRSRFVCSTAY